MRKPVHWKCLGCNRHLATIEDMRISVTQTTKCSSCKAINKIVIESEGAVIECRAEYTGEPAQKRIG